MPLTQHETREAMNGLLQLVYKHIRQSQQVYTSQAFWIAQAQGSAEQLARLAFTLKPEMREPAARQSSVDTLRFYEGSKGEQEAAENVLRAAADYLYNRQTEKTWEAADRGDAAAIDLLDDLRGMDWGDLKQTALIDAAHHS